MKFNGKIWKVRYAEICGEVSPEHVQEGFALVQGPLMLPHRSPANLANLDGVR